MKKILLIAQKEFLSRVKKKSFLIATLLTPLLFPTFFVGMAYLGKKDLDNERPKEVLVWDESGLFSFDQESRYVFSVLESDSGGDYSVQLQQSGSFAYLHIPQFNIDKPEGIRLFSFSNLSLNESSEITNYLEKQLREIKIKESGIDSTLLASLNPSVKIKLVKVSETGEEKTANAMVTFGIGYVLSLLIYMFVFVYGAQVMQSVIEEKTGKIVEIIVSIVKPTQLMMGKVVGIASVGLVQFGIWVLIGLVLSVFSAGILSSVMGTPEIANADTGEMMQEMGNEWIAALMQIPFLKIITLFFLYFVGGFMLYGAMFAAIGSAVESAQEAQQFVFPITIPMIVALVGSMSFVMQNPGGSISFWFSVIPFTSPIAMMARIAFGVPIWELVLSLVLLFATTAFILWAAGRIYRVGILTQGSKVNYKTLLKWFWKG